MRHFRILFSVSLIVIIITLTTAEETKLETKLESVECPDDVQKFEPNTTLWRDEYKSYRCPSAETHFLIIMNPGESYPEKIQLSFYDCPHLEYPDCRLEVTVEEGENVPVIYVFGRAHYDTQDERYHYQQITNPGVYSGTSIAFHENVTVNRVNKLDQKTQVVMD